MFLSKLFVLCTTPALLVLDLSAAAQTAASSASEKPTYLSDPNVTAQIEAGNQQLKRQQWIFAGDAYKKANKLAGGKCYECLRGLYNAQIAGADFKNAATTAIAMEAIATSPAGKSVAEMRQAQAMVQGAGDKPKPEKLEAAHAVLQQAISNYPKNAAALFLDGKVLAELGKMEEAKADFTKCLDCVDPKDPARIRAQHFAEDPELSTHRMAPPFEVTALDGSKFNLDAMGGRVVLIDFWATWCGPCNRALPELKKIAKQFAGEPLVIISVSWDNDEAKWKDFIQKNEMTWVQYRDEDHKLSEQFGVQAIPHYFTIDSDGVLTSEMLGEDSDVQGKLKKLIAKAHQAQKETVAATPRPERAAGN